jgi:choline monooxygenase
VRPDDSTSRVFRNLAGDDEAFYYWIFPNFMLNIYQGSLQTNVVVPLAHDRTLVIFEWYYAEPGTAESWNGLQDSIAFSDQVQREDIELCHDVQTNLQTGVYDRGRFSVRRENGVHHFQRLYSEFLAG